MSTAVEQILEAIRALPVIERVELEYLLMDLNIALPDPELRSARAASLRGKFANLPGSVDEFLTRKHEDTARER